MPESEPKTTVGATVTPKMKSKIKALGHKKEWSMGQTLRLFIDRYWTDWEKELGLEFEEDSSKYRETDKS
ncbi:MAG: hypothetical protein F6J89_09270 [Symploca sp. SIO1C4]|uniref:Uncharacterized protein n=1 Tax=Symploca sp. SIO1C4 TaxID=2607765 RepID=A0A6B3N284_9CYAN|nr:hypothetical protein [Symploca sp. SIO1C4]